MANSTDLNHSSAADQHSSLSGNQALFSYQKFKHLQSLRAYATTSKQTQMHEIQICILSDRDAFGYQELLERDVDYRSCTVRCLKNESPVVTIDKTALVSIVRSNPRVLDLMKAKWTQFLVDRVSNKLFVEQMLQEANDASTATAANTANKRTKEQQKEREL